MKKPPIFGEVALVGDPSKPDPRRDIREFNGEQFAVQLFEIKASDLPLGKHAHAKKFEVFTILEGGGLLLTCRVDGKGNQLRELENHNLVAGSVVRLEPYTAHTFYLAPGSKMHCYSSAPFDPTDFIPTPFLV